MVKRRILLVDDEPAILLTLKALLDIHGFEVETASSARDAKAKLRNSTFHMVITDMRMENEEAGLEVARAAKKTPYQPAVALLTAFPLNDDVWRDDGADEMLVKPMNSQVLIQQLEALLIAHEDKKKRPEKVQALSAAASEERRKTTPRSSSSARS
jgi:DNA-binding response OmpR family regulator